jgi:HEAT repeat protein
MTNETPPALDAAGDSGPHPGESILGAVEVAFDRAASLRATPPMPAPPGTHSPVPSSPSSIEPTPSGLQSPDPQERRRALSRIVETGLVVETRAVGRLLLTDPDPDLRWEAAEALADASGTLPTDLVERALADPSDRVRAAVVRVAARMGPSSAEAIIPLATRRGWPMTQQAALAVLPDLIGPVGPTQQEIDVLLGGVGEMDPPPLRSERPGLEAVARAVGTARLLRELGAPGKKRLGAARLLLVEGSPESLRPLADLSEDPVEGVRLIAAGAAHLLESYQESPERGDGNGGVSQARTLAAAPEPGGEDLLGSVVLALGDPDPLVRAQAISALRGIDPLVLESWAVRTLTDGPAEMATAAAMLAEHIGLTAAAGPLMQRASSVGPLEQGPFVRALSALRLDRGDLARVVSSIDSAHRQSAVRLAWSIAGKAILPHLSPLLDDTAGPVRMAALEVFAESGDPSATSLARRLLESDSSAAVRATAVHVLARADAETRSEVLAQALSDPDPDVRATAVEALPRSSTVEMVSLLLRALQDDDERVWRAAIGHLASLPARELSVLWSALRQSPKSKREELLTAIEAADSDRLATLAVQSFHSPRPVERQMATEIAARAATPECSSLVAAALSDPDPRVRRTAAAAMSTLRTPAGVAALARTLSDPNAEVRVEAVRALGMIDDDAVPDILISALKDPEIRVRDMAGEALGRWHSPAVARRLAAALGSPDLRRPAGDVLKRMGHAAVQPLVDVVMGDDREAAAAAGALLQATAGAQSFLPSLGSVDPDARLRAVEVLGAIGGPAASEALLTTLFDPEPRIRVRSATLLGALGDLMAVRPLRRVFQGDPVGEVAAAAEEALRALGAGVSSGDVQILDDVPEDLPGPSRD